MRAGGCAVQQALAAEAASVVRQAVTLARRRGHAQVTPLHVATAMLLPPAPAGVLRAACLRSHSHPLQCKALELCFNVALNRLPTASGAGAMFHQHRLGGAAPALSNALVAAFKRAQAHQRRGGAGDGIQQTAAPVIAAKVELEQLIVSILDDPSVSRVMREAGFSSSQVKANVEKAVSSSSPSGTNTTRTSSTQESRGKSVSHNDAMRVLECMASGAQRCLVVVGEGAEAAVKAVMDRVSKADLPYHQHERLKSVQFVPLSIASFRGLAKEEVEVKAGELRALLREACAAGKGVVLVLEDLAYAAEAWQTRRGSANVHGGQSRHYCPVEHAVMEVSGLVSGDSGSGGGRFWLIGFASSMVFLRCRVGQPSLEAVWGIHPVVVPDGGGLVLSLSCTSEAQASQQARRSTIGWPLVSSSAVTGDSHLTCYANARTPSPEPSIPSWLRRYHDPYHTTPASSGGSNLEQLQDLWNPTRNGSATHHHTSELTLSFSSPLSPSASSLSGCNITNPMMLSSSKPWHLEPRTRWPPNHHGPAIMTETRLDYHQLHTATNPSPESISVQSNSTSPDGGGTVERCRPKFTELTAENLKILCSTLEDGVPRHIKDVAAGVASTVLRCRSGMARRRQTLTPTPSSATWLLFQGSDGDGKKAMALELAKLVFGSYNDFTSISSAGFTPVHSGSSSGEFARKRQRSPDYEHGYPQRFYEVIHENPRRVVMIEDIEQLDIGSEMSIKKAIKSGRMRDCNGNEVSLEDAIVVLSCEAFDSRSRASSPRVKQRVSINNGGDEEDSGVEKEKMKPPCFSLDLNACAATDDDRDGDEEEEERLVDDVEISDVVDGVFFFRLAIGLSH
ncbi:hypothetical protein ACQ4PT_043712 [Festuca glaucescens]